MFQGARFKGFNFQAVALHGFHQLPRYLKVRLRKVGRAASPDDPYFAEFVLYTRSLDRSPFTSHPTPASPSLKLPPSSSPWSQYPHL